MHKMASDLLASRFTHAAAEHAAGRFAEADRLYRQLLASLPNHPQVVHNLGVLAMQAGRVNEGVARFQAALALLPTEAQFWLSYVKALVAAGQLARAWEVLEQGRRQGLAGDEVLTLATGLRDALQSASHDHENRQAAAQQYLQSGDQLSRKGDYPGAIAAYERAAQLTPRNATVYARMGDLQSALHLYLEAENSFQQAVGLAPDSASAWLGLGISQHGTGKISEAQASYLNSLKLEPKNSMALTFFAVAQDKLGHASEAEATYRKALAANASEPLANSNLLFLLAYQGQHATEVYLHEARQWEHRMLSDTQRTGACARMFKRSPGHGRRLRIGYLSGDFYQHAVAVFLESLLESHDRQRVEIHAYVANTRSDDLTVRLSALSDHWHRIAELSDDAVRDLIEHDKIDVLVDLSGHTAGNRLGVIARRAAPVQAHYLGYFASTGLSEMDYWIADKHLVPEGAQSQFSETVWRLPRAWVSYRGSAEAPAVQWQAASDGAVVFGSFNSLGKLTDRSLMLWSSLLHRLPAARLVLKTKELDEPANRQRIQSVFQLQGIGAERLELRGNTPTWEAHMAMYNDIDIALDPVGTHCGVTTTCDALWMGVPVISLAGDRLAHRQGVSLLTALGHSEWVAFTEEDYLAKVVTLALAVETRQTLRHGQRERMRNSPLCDAKALALALEDAYEEMFEQSIASKQTLARGKK